MLVRTCHDSLQGMTSVHDEDIEQRPIADPQLILVCNLWYWVVYTNHSRAASARSGYSSYRQKQVLQHKRCKRPFAVDLDEQTSGASEITVSSPCRAMCFQLSWSGYQHGQLRNVHFLYLGSSPGDHYHQVCILRAPHFFTKAYPACMRWDVTEHLSSTNLHLV